MATANKRATSIMSTLDRIRMEAEQHRDDARAAWMDALKLVLANPTDVAFQHIEEVQRVYLLRAAELAGMSVMWVAAVETYNVNGESTGGEGNPEGLRQLEG